MLPGSCFTRQVRRADEEQGGDQQRAEQAQHQAGRAHHREQASIQTIEVRFIQSMDKGEL